MGSRYRGVRNLSAIEVKNLTVRYDGYVAIEDVSITIDHPSLVVVMGPNGAGKTTFLKALLGLIPYNGTVSIFGKSPRKVRDRLGYLPQRERINLNVPLKVRDVVLLPLISRKTGIKRYDVKRAKEALEAVGMVDFWDSRFDSLSGGQQQRVLFARTIVTDPDILILDEPFSAADVRTKLALIDLLHKLKREKTVIIVLHDINPLVECTDRVILLNRRVLAYGTVAEVITEDNLEKLYGTKIPVIRQGPVCYVVGGDRHA